MILACQKIEKAFGGKSVLNNVNFLINEGEKAAVIGINGAGKTTLFKIITGEYEADNGEVIFQKGSTYGYLSQVIDVSSHRSIYEEMLDAKKEIIEMEKKIRQLEKDISTLSGEALESAMESYSRLTDRFEKANGYAWKSEITGVLKGLGFDESQFATPIHTLSGGQKTRVALSRILLMHPDLILLDEPTNHLDIESISWLESFLQTYSGAVVLVSHDRAFLDNVTTRTLEISLGKVYDYKVAYSQFEQLHKERIEQQMRAYQNQQKQIKDTEDFIERFRYKATKSVQVQSRIKQLEKLERIEVEEEDMARITVRFQPAVRSGEIVLTGKELTKAYGDHVVLKGIQLDIKRGEKIAFVGKNGEGKSTLVKMIMNEIPFEGELKIGHHVNIGYFAQNQADLLDPEVSVLDTVDRVAEGEIRKKIRDILGAFLFSGEEVDKKVKVLSGGERTRLAMVRLLLEPYNLLILDEPTNHLDMRTKDILKEALRKFEGTVIVVSHDRDFLTGLADKVYEFANQHIKEYLGGITDFLAAKKIACFREYEQLHKPKGNGISNDEAEREVSENKLSFEERKQLNKEIRKAEQRVERAEQRVTELESEVAALEKQMAAGVVNDELLKKYGETQKELEEAMTEWEKATEEEEEVKSKR